MGLLRRCLPCRKRSSVLPEEEESLACCRPTETHYHSRDFLVQELVSGATRLLRPAFILQWFYQTKKPLPKRQDLPESAFLDPAKLTRHKQLEIIAVSYCWLSKEHPDPDRYHLETLVALLELFCKSSYENVAISGERRTQLLLGKASDGTPLNHYLDVVVERRCTRGVPLSPERFNELVDSKIFTDGSDKEKVVKPKYAETFRVVITNAHALHLRGLGLDDAQARQLLDLTAEHCKCIIELDLSCNDISLPVELTIGSKTMAQLRRLNLTGCGRGSAVPFDVAPLADLVHLKQLELAGAFVSGDVAPLATLQDLEVLWLTGTKVSGDVGVLAKLRYLQRLGLGSTFVSGDMTPLSTVTFLERLGLNETQVYGDVADVGKLKHLVRLGLGGTKVSGDVARLHALWNLEVLDLNRTAVSGDVARLSHLVCLTVLELRSTAVSGDIAGLSSLTRLEKLDLSFTEVSGDAVPLARLRRMKELDFRKTRVQKGWERMTRHFSSDSLEDAE